MRRALAVPWLVAAIAQAGNVIESPAVVYRPLAGALASIDDDATTLARVGVRTVVVLAGERTRAACEALRAAGVPRVVAALADPTDRDGLGAVLAASDCVRAFVVGWEGLAAGRYDLEALDDALASVRAGTTRPLATVEPIVYALAHPAVARRGDFTLATLPPTHVDERGAQDACGRAIFRWRELRAALPEREVAVATGLPTAGPPWASVHRQRAYFDCLASRDVAFVMHEAFDQPGDGTRPGGAHGGLFRADGSPKRWAALASPPAVVAARSASSIAGRVEGLAPRRSRVGVYRVDADGWRLVATPAPDAGGAWSVANAGGDRALVVVTRPGRRPPARLDGVPAADGDRVLAVTEVGR